MEPLHIHVTRDDDILKINFILDSGVSEVSISPDVALTLTRTGTVTKEDWLPGKAYQFADGSSAKSQGFTIRKIRIGNRVLENISCRISSSINAPRLFGPSALEKLGRFMVDYGKGVMRLDWLENSDPAVTMFRLRLVTCHQAGYVARIRELTHHWLICFRPLCFKRNDMATTNISELRKLPNIEKLKIIESLWSDLAAGEAGIPAPHWHEAELRRTEEEYAAGRMEALGWREAKKELRQRFE